MLRLKLAELYNYWETKLFKSFHQWCNLTDRERHLEKVQYLKDHQLAETTKIAVKTAFGKIIKRLQTVKYRAFTKWSRGSWLRPALMGNNFERHGTISGPTA